MKYLKTYNNLITETLKSDEIEIVCKKLSNFFDNLGFHKKNGYFEDVESPYYLIVSDRDYMKSNVEKYSNPTNRLKKSIKKHRMSAYKLASYFKKNLEEFKYGDIAIFTDKNNPEISKNLLHLINSMGYFVAGLGNKSTQIKDKSEILEELCRQEKISLFIEPVYDSQANLQGEYLYHTTDKKYLDKIMRLGLIPKSKNTRSFYPERIYLSPNLEYNRSIKNQLGSDKPGEYVDLKIKKFPELKLYKDVRFKGGFYTYTNIPPKYIEIINI